MIERLLKSLRYRLIGKRRNRLTLFNSQLKSYINKGNLVIGKNSDVDQLSLVINGNETGICNVTIGDDCYIMGSIVLHQPQSKVIIGDRVFIGPNTTLFCYDQITISDDVMISWGCTLIDTNAHSLRSKERKDDVIMWKKGWQCKDWSNVLNKPIVVHSKCWIGFNSIVTKGVTLQEGTVVASGSVVSKNTEKYTIIGGNPAQFIKNTE